LTIRKEAPRMEVYVLTRLKSLRNRNAKNSDAKNENLYKLLCKKDLLAISYNTIKSTPGNMTPGTDNETLDGYSETIVDKAIVDLKNQSFKFKPVRRKYIPKEVTGKTRSLGILSPRDKIIQKAMLLILEAVYEPTFLTHSHSFRKCRNCHAALAEMKSSWGGVKWAIKGDIKGCYENIDHHILISILRKKINDDKFIQLVWKLLRAGLITKKNEILSPLLANIYLHEFDTFLLKLTQSYQATKPRRNNLAYKRVSGKIDRLREKLAQYKIAKKSLDKIQKAIEIEQQLQRSMPSGDPMDPEFKKVLFVRYDDDWIIGIIGSKKTAIKIKELIDQYLGTQLKLILSPDKTKISYFPNKEVQFLGFDVSSGGPSTNTYSSTLSNRKSVGWQFRIFVPMIKVIKQLSDKNFCTKVEGIALRKKGWIMYPDEIIIQKYNYILRGLRNYYAPADNFGTSTNRIQYILAHSCAHTLANKHRTKISVQLRRLSKLGLDRIKKGIVTNNTMDFRTHVDSFESIFMLYENKINILSSNKCRICSDTENLEMHHVKAFRKDSVPLEENIYLPSCNT
jgi:group II intron reverse transcriptase/maturase